EALRNDGTAGRVSMVSDPLHGITAVGKFGWKAQVPSLMVFSADAYLNEMGITSPIFPNENCPSGVCDDLYWNPVPAINNDGHAIIAFNNFMTMLDAPPRGKISGEVVAGEKIFGSIGCDSCHTPNMTTGWSDIRALRHKPFHPYSDFLLHDMGSLGDGIAQGTSDALEMRTAPLWGLRVVTKFLHDGRALTIEDAILAHDGQGRAARDRFAALNADAKSKLLAFLNSL
ncbi:MAG TPA: di-heme oxidoredictase family protein, partial [Thermoanaerobaculia bacterium]|nr:di-heme oxidoredictase family protein [Thermoanaerobaculia bacterium]